MSLSILCRIIFSAHSYVFSDHVHQDRTPEITVSAMSCNARDDPGFVFATFEKTGRAVSISYCSLARESHILLVYIVIMFLFCLLCLKGQQQGRLSSPNEQTNKKGPQENYQRKRIGQFLGKLNSTILLTPPIFKLKRCFAVINLVPSQDALNLSQDR